MERYENQFDRAKFDAVWRRVMGDDRESGPLSNPKSQRADQGEDEKLRRFMDDEACDAQFYATLACKYTGMARQILQRISSDEKCHLKRLRARYFILTGKTYTLPDTCPLIYSPADALRRKYSGEKEGAQAYLDAAEQTGDPDLRDTYLALSQDEARHSKMVGSIIENMF